MFEFIYINISCPPIMLLHSLDYFFFFYKAFLGIISSQQIYRRYKYTQNISSAHRNQTGESVSTLLLWSPYLHRFTCLHLH